MVSISKNERAALNAAADAGRRYAVEAGHACLTDLGPAQWEKLAETMLMAFSEGLRDLALNDTIELETASRLASPTSQSESGAQSFLKI